MWIVGITLFVLLAVLPIAGLWTWHVQEMAKLKTKNSDNSSPAEILEIKKEVTELRQMITSLAINVENMKDNYAHVSDLEDRMRVGK